MRRISEFIDSIAKELNLTDVERRVAVSALRFIKSTEVVSPNEELTLKRAVASYIESYRQNTVDSKDVSAKTVTATQSLTREPPPSVMLNRCPICHRPYTIIMLPGGVEARYCPEHRIVVPFPGENKIKYPIPHTRDGAPIIPV